jgi:hypothetical protein
MGNVGARYYADTYYQSDAYRQKLEAARDTEAERQALLRGEATAETLAYARFLNAVENDATLSHGRFKPFQYSDTEVLRAWPFLEAEIRRQET